MVVSPFRMAIYLLVYYLFKKVGNTFARCRNSYKKTACTFPYARTYKKESAFRYIRGKCRMTKIFNEKKELVTTKSRIDYREFKKLKGLWRPSNGIEREKCLSLEGTNFSRSIHRFSDPIRGKLVPFRIHVPNESSRVHLCFSVGSRVTRSFCLLKQRHFRVHGEKISALAHRRRQPPLSLALSLALFPTQQVDRCFRRGT